MRAGKMRYRVTVQKPVNETIRRGIPNEYEDVATVWASIVPSKTAESVSGAKRVAIGDYEIRLWSIQGMNETWRIVHGTRIYNVVQTDEPNPLLKETLVLAKRNKKDAEN